MTITEQIRLKLKTVDDYLVETRENLYRIRFHAPISADASVNYINIARRILREICEVDGESEE